MQITDVHLKKVNEGTRMRAVASVCFDDEFVIHEIKVIQGDNGLFISMPSRRGRNGQHKDVAHPISTEARKKIEDAILKKYNAGEARKEESAE